MSRIRSGRIARRKLLSFIKEVDKAEGSQISGHEDGLSDSLKIWNEINPDENVPECDGEVILQRIHYKLGIQEESVKFKSGKIFNYMVKAAAILFIPLLSFLVYRILTSQLQDGNDSIIEITVPEGMRADFILPDSTYGKLNGGSTLKFPKEFTNKERKVQLSGEAFFNVTSNKKRPFIVTTKNIELLVTGTSFNIKAYSDDIKNEVILKKGEVRVFEKVNSSLNSLATLKPNESLTYFHVSDSTVINSIDSEKNLSWIDGKLIFKYEPFDKVVNELNDFYGVDIIIKDELLKSYIYYGTFQNEPLDEVLNLLKYTAPIEYKNIVRNRKPDGTFEKRRIEIYKK